MLFQIFPLWFYNNSSMCAIRIVDMCWSTGSSLQAFLYYPHFQVKKGEKEGGENNNCYISMVPKRNGSAMNWKCVYRS